MTFFSRFPKERASITWLSSVLLSLFILLHSSLSHSLFFHLVSLYFSLTLSLSLSHPLPPPHYIYSQAAHLKKIVCLSWKFKPYKKRDLSFEPYSEHLVGQCIPCEMTFSVSVSSSFFSSSIVSLFLLRLPSLFYLANVPSLFFCFQVRLKLSGVFLKRRFRKLVNAWVSFALTSHVVSRRFFSSFFYEKIFNIVYYKIISLSPLCGKFLENCRQHCLKTQNSYAAWDTYVFPWAPPHRSPGTLQPTTWKCLSLCRRELYTKVGNKLDNGWDILNKMFLIQELSPSLNNLCLERQVDIMYIHPEFSMQIVLILFFIILHRWLHPLNFRTRDRRIFFKKLLVIKKNGFFYFSVTWK